MMRSVVLFFIAMIFCLIARAQTETNYWFQLVHQQYLSKKWSAVAEVQLRSADKAEYLRTLFFRPSVNYHFKENQSATLGYGYFANWSVTNDVKSFTHEHRLWEQYQIKHTLSRIRLTNRFRLEQRFVESATTVLFSQRFRYFLRAVIPFGDKAFNKGIYGAAQNEVFVNIQNRDNVNDRFFDQNRTFAAIGYRFFKGLDAEFGYMFRYQEQRARPLRNNIFQIAVFTELRPK